MTLSHTPTMLDGSSHHEVAPLGASIMSAIKAVRIAKTGRAGFGLDHAASLEPVLLQLAAYAALSPEEADAVRRLSIDIRSAPRGTELIAEGAVGRAGFLVSGWACRQRELPDGRRQIIGIVLPGDSLVPLLLPEEQASCATVALTGVQVANAAPLRAMLERAELGQYRGLRQACARAERAEATRMMERIISLGRRTAYERLYSLFVELHQRLKMVGLTDGQGFAMPLTQETMADALGLSPVHLNRTLQQARHDGLLAMRSGWARLLRHDGTLAAE